MAYGREHQELRADLAPIVATGTVECWRCHQLIEPGEPWDLGHDDNRTMIMGPEHRLQRPGCIGNRAAGWKRLSIYSRRAIKRQRTQPAVYGGDPGWNDDDQDDDPTDDGTDDP